MEVKSEFGDGSLLLLVAFLLVNAPNCHLSLELASVAYCNTILKVSEHNRVAHASPVIYYRQVITCI